MGLCNKRSFDSMSEDTTPKYSPFAKIQAQSPTKPSTTQKLFSVKDLNDIVNKALAEREEQLREAHDNTLSHHIQVQMESLSKYNQEFVSQRLRSSEFNYMA